jgi:uncharacterized protein YfiM (DUF2279 family)
MGSYFIYDSINQYRSDNTVSEGTSNGTVFSPGSAITDHERSSDQNIGTILSAVANNDGIQYAVGSSVTANAAAVYFTGDDNISSGTSANFHISDNTTIGASKGTITAVSAAGWATTDLTETAGTKFYTIFAGTVTNVSEVLIGSKLSFEVEPDVNIQSSIDYENSIQKSLGGVEYALNINPGQEVTTIGFQNISSTFKDNLITMQDAIKGEAKKFVWFDGTNYHWVRLDKSMQFTEIADGRWSTQIKMRQQIQ